MSLDDDRLARVALSRLAEPGDVRMTGLVSELGALRVYRLLADESGADPLKDDVAARLTAVDPVRELDQAARLGLRFVTPADEEWPAQLADLTRRVDDLTPPDGRWFSYMSGVKHRAVTAAKQIVDEAMLVAGGSSYFTRSELSRLYRDVLAGMFHPSDPESAHSTVATAWLGPIEG